MLHPAKGEIWVEARGTPEAQPDGSVIWYGYFHDVTTRKRMEEALRERVLTQKKRERQIRFLAYHDALTRLPNRALLLSRLHQAIAHTQRSEETLAVMFLDVDRFKTINDTLGHPAGDTLLQQIGRRLTETLRVGDTVARAGGDEFLLLVPGLHSPEEAGPVAEHVLASLSAPFIVSGQTLRVTGSVGLSICPRDAADVESLIKYADTALYLAKEQGRNTFRFFSPDLDAKVRARMHLENDLRLAVDRNEFLLHYQPQIELATGRIIGVEALLRWLHPQRGLVLPGAFIPTAEETGLILPIGEWALRTACVQARAWQEAGGPQLRIAVNISSKQLNGADIVGVVGRTLAETRCDPRLLGLEITESAVMADPRDAIRVIRALHELGLEVTIDDFGTGYSSMAYLKRFALDRLKIDATFIRGTPEDKDDVAIVQATIALARQFRLRVTAEGVETAAQRAFLQAHDCDAIQGFLISAPLPGQDIAALFARLLRNQDAGDFRAVALAAALVIGGHREVPGGSCQSAHHVTRQPRVRDRDTLLQLRSGPVVDVVAREIGQDAAVVVLRRRYPGECRRAGRALLRGRRLERTARGRWTRMLKAGSTAFEYPSYAVITMLE